MRVLMLIVVLLMSGAAVPAVAGPFEVLSRLPKRATTPLRCVCGSLSPSREMPPPSATSA